MNRIELLGESSTLSGKRYVNDAIGVVIERTAEQVNRPTSFRSSDMLMTSDFALSAVHGASDSGAM